MGPSSETIVKSTCRLCYNNCGVQIQLRDGKPVKIYGDTDNPFSKGKLCPKGLASLEYLNHPDRLTDPLKRIDKRGANQWRKITWDEALGSIAEGLNRVKDTYGARSVVFIRGASKGLSDSYISRFANIFGSPNITSPAPYCFVPLVNGSRFTYGFYAYPDYDHPPKCILVWGANLKATRLPDYEAVLRAVKAGAKLIVVDPLPNDLTEIADVWIKVRPGADLALALGIIKVILAENLHDKDFVNTWTVGYSELQTHVKNYSLSEIEKITWVPQKKIIDAARLYSTQKPACIPWGNGIESNINSLQTARAISILRALSGNLSTPGGDIYRSKPGGLDTKYPELSCRDLIPEGVRADRLSKADGLLPIFYYSLPQTIMRAILDDTPYPVRGAYIQAANPLTHYPNAGETHQALKKLNFFAVADHFMTPTAMLADIVLPAATYLEYDSVEQPWDFPIASVQQKVIRIGQCRSDGKILNELAGKMGFETFVWKDMRQPLDLILKNSGVTFDEFRNIGYFIGGKIYRHYEKEGFDTPSGKVELYSHTLKNWGYDPLPTYREPPETMYSEPELADDYPLIMTSRKDTVYRHSGGRQIPSLRKRISHPTVRIHPTTADRFNIKEEDLVNISTKRGCIRQKAHLDDRLHPGTIAVDYAWWFPEKKDSYLFGWEEANINILTSNTPPFSREMGSPCLRGILCKISKAK